MRPYFWRPWDKEYTPLTDDMIHETEAKLGVKLPDSYLDVMRERNGGLLRFDLHPAPERYTWKCIFVHKFESILPNTTLGSILTSKNLNRTWNMPEALVLLGGYGHTWIALDYRNSAPDLEPSVVFVDNDDPEPVFPLAPNFETFMNGLVDGIPSHVIGFVGVGETVDILRERINRLLDVDFKRRVLPNGEVLFVEQKPEWESSLESYADLCLQRNSPSYYPWFPQCDWLFFYDVNDYQIAEDVWQKISQNCGYEAVKIHTPSCHDD